MQKILQLCDKNAIAKPVFSNKLFCYMQYGAVGELLKKFLWHEWWQSNIINTEIGIFPYHVRRTFTGEINKDLEESYDYVRKLHTDQLPFGIAVEAANVSKAAVELLNENKVSEEEKLFYPQECTFLRTYVFVTPAESTHFFHKWQRQRKMWWRKFSASPGRFMPADIQTNDEGKRIDIQAHFPWGFQKVETIRHRETLNMDTSSGSKFEAKHGRKKVLPHVIESSLALEPAVFTFICDAYDENTILGMPREVMKFHRKLAPYKLSFSASASSAVTADELCQLAAYLTKQLRTAGISTLLLPDMVKRSMESNFERYDELGIPYTIILNEGTLKTGITGLRNRDTTLKEQVHIIKLREYMEQILKNY